MKKYYISLLLMIFVSVGLCSASEIKLQSNAGLVGYFKVTQDVWTLTDFDHVNGNDYIFNLDDGKPYNVETIFHDSKYHDGVGAKIRYFNVYNRPSHLYISCTYQSGKWNNIYELSLDNYSGENIWINMPNPGFEKPMNCVINYKSKNAMTVILPPIDYF